MPYRDSVQCAQDNARAYWTSADPITTEIADTMVSDAAIVIDAYAGMHPDWQEWRHRIDLSTLDMRLGSRCVLGQIMVHLHDLDWRRYGSGFVMAPDELRFLPGTAYWAIGLDHYEGTSEALRDAWLRYLAPIPAVAGS